MSQWLQIDMAATLQHHKTANSAIGMSRSREEVQSATVWLQ